MGNSGDAKDELLSGGDVSIVRFDIYSSVRSTAFDMKKTLVGLSIFEDMERNYIRGEAMIVDSLNILMDAPFIGNEKVVVEFKTPSHETTLKFIGQLTRIYGHEKLKQGTQSYVIDFISPEFVRNQKTLFSKSYNKMYISDMVGDIYKNYLSDVGSKKMSISPTRNASSRVVPNMSPFGAIRWLTQAAQSKRYPTGSSYVFFENQNGYHFGSLEEISRGPVAATYKNNIVSAQEGQNRDIRKAFYNIMDYSIETPDVLAMIQGGVFASRGMSHDLVTRTTSTTEFNYFDTYKDMAHTSPNKTGGVVHNDTRLGSYSASHDILIPQHYSAFDDKSNSHILGNLTQVRTSQLAQFGVLGVTITVPGDSNRTVGEIVDLKMPGVGTMTLDDRKGDGDKYMSGRYIISALRHIISIGSEDSTYKMVMSLKKDSYEDSLPTSVVTHWS